MARPADSDALQPPDCTDDLPRLRHVLHERYSVPSVDFHSWVLGRLPWRGDEWVLDVGAGSGLYVEPLRACAPHARLVALDREAAFLQRNPAAPALAVADALELPFATGRFDLVMANQLLAHVPDVDAALIEMKRVLRPGGLLMTAANSANSMPEFNALFRRAVLLLAHPGAAQPPMYATNALYTLESGLRRLSRRFYAVVRYDLPQLLVFDEVEPAVAYFASWRTLRESSLPTEVAWEDVMLLMREQISRVVNTTGELVVNKVSGVLIASDRPGLVAPSARDLY